MSLLILVEETCSYFYDGVHTNKQQLSCNRSDFNPLCDTNQPGHCVTLFKVRAQSVTKWPLLSLEEETMLELN